jgi:cell division protein FtsL
MSEDPLSRTINSIPPEKLEVLREEMFDFRTSGSKHVEAAHKFQSGLDKVTDVLLILVMKFSRSTTVLLIAGLFNLVLLITLIICTVNILMLRSEMRDLMDRQESFARSQSRIEKTTNETQEKVASTSKAVEETQAKVEAAPKIELDRKTGKAKLVVQVPPKPRPTPAASGAPKQIEIKLE